MEAANKNPAQKKKSSSMGDEEIKMPDKIKETANIKLQFVENLKKRKGRDLKGGAAAAFWDSERIAAKL